jgi:5'-nucleotidase
VLLHEGGNQTGPTAYDINGCNGLSGPIVPIAAGMSPAIDVVITGHTHQAYNCNLSGKLVTSASSFGRLVTDIDLSIDRRTGDVLTAEAENVIVTRDVAKAPAQTELIARYREALGPIAGRVVGSTTAAAHPDPGAALRRSARRVRAREPHRRRPAGGDRRRGRRRRRLHEPRRRARRPRRRPVTYEEAFTVQPFANNLVTLDLTGAQLQCLLEQQFQVGRTLYPSATVSYVVDLAGTTAGAGADPCSGTRVVDATVSIGGTPVTAGATYRVTVNNFLAGGGDQFSVLTGGTNAVTGDIDLDAFTAYLGARSPVAAPALDRIRTTAEAPPAP